MIARFQLVDDGISVAATKKIYLNKTEDTYIDSDSTDRLRAVAGGSTNVGIGL